MTNVTLGIAYSNVSFSHVKREKGWQTIKRPGVDAFLEHLAQYYEIVVYSDYSNMVKLLFPMLECGSKST